MSSAQSLVPRTALVDTSVFYALAVRSSASFVDAQRMSGRLVRERWRLVTTNVVIAETHALMLARRNRDDAVRVLRQIDHSSTIFVRAEEADERRASDIIDQYDDKDFSLTDAISFAIMERFRIAHAFTFDRHVAQFGFAVLGGDNQPA